ncbi:hypothetical protein I4U23_016352 [Adineta vaga]|nr:hypothetical protein I4U23_016352 [Adineta vaga]
MKMQLEFLPNEIFIQFFKYFNMIDIFYSFDQLNDRFNILIRSIPLSLNFRNVYQRFLCDQLCNKMSMDTRIKEQIRSLHLSNKNTCYPIHLFISKFSLSDFSHLRSLTLTEFTECNWKQIQPTFPLLSELTAFRQSGSSTSSDMIFDLPLSQFHTLMILLRLPESIPLIQFSSIVNLTVNECSFYLLFQLVNNASKLQYLTVRFLIPSIMLENSSLKENHTNHLKRLCLGNFPCSMSYLVMIFQRTPKLEHLIIMNDDNNGIANAYEWQKLITSFLPHLTLFKFEFFLENCEKESMVEFFNQFQSDFWCNQHHWYTECFLSGSSGSIYTIPYSFNTFYLPKYTKKCTNESIKHGDSFDSLRHLTITLPTSAERLQYYFPNIVSLKLDYKFEHPSIFYRMTYDDLKDLSRIVNLLNIKHLNTDTMIFRSANVFQDLLKAMPQLSSLDMASGVLIEYLNNDELRKYLNKSIKKFKIRFGIPGISGKLEEFCHIFSNLEELCCDVNESNTLFLLKSLPKLTYLCVHPAYLDHLTYKIEEAISTLGLDITCHFHDHSKRSVLSIWINRNKNIN